MKKFIAGLIVGAVLFVPSGALAYQLYSNDGLPTANDIYQFNCDTSYEAGRQCNHVAVFDDQDNKCYITYDSVGNRNAPSAISCVKSGGLE